MLKLHLGCGEKYIPGWFHIDVCHLPHINLVHAVDRLPMIEDDSVDEIYSCHVFEHFTSQQAPDVLNEWHRILKPGARMRIAVPDFESLAKYYLETYQLGHVLGPLFGGHSRLYDIHHTVYDFTTLKKLLEAHRFQGINKYDWQQTEHAHTDDYAKAHLPHLPFDRHGNPPPEYFDGTPISLNVECFKGIT